MRPLVHDRLLLRHLSRAATWCLDTCPGGRIAGTWLGSRRRLNVDLHSDSGSILIRHLATLSAEWWRTVDGLQLKLQSFGKSLLGEVR